MSVDLTKENPYVAVAAKKQRNLKKKLEKILKIEQNQQAGKTLDQEQLILLNSKKSVEKALQDVAALKAQLEEVAKQELEGRTEEPQDENKEDDAQPQVDEDAANTANVETNTDAQQQENVEQFAVSTMTEPVSEASKVQDEAHRRAEFEEKTIKLLKALHVYQRYKDVTGRNLPDTVDFFGRTLLGLTTISAFQGTLQHSARYVGYYLNDDLAAQNEVIRGCNYLQMSAIIDALADEMEKVPANRAPSSGHLTALLRNSISAPAMHPSEPTINLPPVPHVPPTQPELPIVAELSPTKFDLPQPQAVPQFVHIEAPSFGTLQFGEGFGSSAASLGRTEYATINFQSEPFFQLTPPLSASQPSISQPPPQPQLVSLTHHQPAVVQVLVEEPVVVEQTVVVEIETAPVEESSPVEEVAKNETTAEEAAEGEKSGSPRNPRNNNRDRRNNRFNRRDEKDGAEGEGDQKRGGSNRHRRKFDQKDENAAATATANNGEEGEGKQPYKKRSYRFDRNKNETGEFHTGGDAAEQKEGKDFNYAKKFNKRDGKKEAAQTEAAAPAAEEPVKAEAPVAKAEAPAPAPAAEPVEAPKPAAPVKRSSYQDAVRANLNLPEEPAAEKDAKKKPFVKKTDEANNDADNKAPRRDRSNNRVPRERDNQNNNSNNNNNNEQGEPRERKPFNNNFNRQGGERKNFDNKPRGNNNNNNNNNNRTVNNNQAVRRPAQPKAEAPANA